MNKKELLKRLINIHEGLENLLGDSSLLNIVKDMKDLSKELDDLIINLEDEDEKEATDEG